MTWGQETFGQLGRAEGNRSKAPGVIRGLTGVQAITGNGRTCVAVLENGRIMTWGWVRPWTRPGNGFDTVSHSPMLLWLDGLEQPPW